MKIPQLVVFVAALLTLVNLVSAQSGPPPLPVESRQFDFWVGEWDVTTPDGKAVGASKVELIAGGAGLLENWTGYPVPTGATGKSLNAYNASRKQWQQFWVGGGVLELSGGLVGSDMVMSGEHDVRGRHLMERITWTPNADGTVRQFWQQSTDDGKTWQTAFDGRYRRRK